MRALSPITPLENLRHVKRIRRKQIEGKSELSIVLHPAFDEGSELGNIPNDVQKLIDTYNLSPFIAKVPMYPATSKEEWEEQCKLWPTSYHPMVNCDHVSGFSEEDSQWIISCMKSTIKLSKQNHMDNQDVNAAMIVDPACREIIASAVDQRPVSADCARDLVESFGKVNVSNVEESTWNESTENCPFVSCLHPWKWPQDRAAHPLKHAVMAAIESSAARDRRLFPLRANKSNELSSSLGSPRKKQKTEAPQDDLEGRPYLCTGFDIFLAWEPCPMCAMALVHQRVRRVFFAFPNPNAGALGSIFRLQGQKSLNHHYSVFRVFAAH
ncbi:cytidine/deoxycytidylate deaminase family protein isoform X2 [Wolffia australiana]